jgi:hypothetical protein
LRILRFADVNPAVRLVRISIAANLPAWTLWNAIILRIAARLLETERYIF